MLLGANGANRKPVLLLRFRQDGSQPHAVFIRPGPGVLRTCGAARSLNHDPYEAPRCRMRSITGGSFAFAIGANNRARNGRLPLNAPGGVTALGLAILPLIQLTPAVSASSLNSGHRSVGTLTAKLRIRLRHGRSRTTHHAQPRCHPRSPASRTISKPALRSAVAPRARPICLNVCLSKSAAG